MSEQPLPATESPIAHSPEQTSQKDSEAHVSESPAEAPYSIFTSREKAFLVILAGTAAFLSPVTANIYYPALNDLARDLDVSYSLINLTITVYLIFQGLAPTLIGSISDAAGRRPAYMLCFIIYFVANLGLALQNSYPALMVLRCLQSSGSSGTVALSNAVAADIATSSERGSYVGYANIGALLGPAIGPIIGGVLNQALGWHAIFWFLVILSAIIMIIFLIFLPETCRNVVGNGSIPPQPWNISLIAYLKQREQRKKGIVPPTLPPTPYKRPNLLGTLHIIFSKEGGSVLLYIGLLFGGFYIIAASLPADLQRVYNFNSLQIGLCYIPFGLGSMTSAVVTGKTVDWNFRRHARMLNIPITKGRQSDTRHFPVERARLEVAVPASIAATLLILAFGWVMRETRALPAPLVILYFLGFSTSGAFGSLSTLMIDLYPKSPGTATAAANWVRCWMGAGAVAATGPLLTSVGTGWVSVLVAGIWILFSPLLIIILKWGPTWREEKHIRDEEKKLIEEAKRVRNSDGEEGGGRGGVLAGTEQSKEASGV